MARTMGIIGAIVVHLGIILFGGLLFMSDATSHGKVIQNVEIISADKPDQDKDKPQDQHPEEAKDLKASDEAPPDAAEIIRNIEQQSAVANQPRLESYSLDALSNLMAGASGSGDFGTGGSGLDGGGVIGGTQPSGRKSGEDLDLTSSLAEIDQPPRVVFQTAPNYPSEMRAAKLEGLVTVLFVVDPEGKVGDLRVEKSSHTAFEKPALDAVKQWKFEPAIRAGQRVAFKMRVPIRFTRS